MIGQLRKKDFFIISEQLGLVMIGIGVVTLIPILVALIYNENNYVYFVIPSGFSIIFGFTLIKFFADDGGRMGLKHGMIIASIAWLWAALIGSLILMQTTNINFLNAYFESMSAWTGSGLSIFADVEILPKSVLFLRSIEQWIGGIGVVIVVIGILIRPGTAAARLYKSEAREKNKTKYSWNCKDYMVDLHFLHGFRDFFYMFLQECLFLMQSTILLLI